jgi:hypothetical protein
MINIVNEYCKKAKKDAESVHSGWSCTLLSLIEKLEKENEELRKKLGLSDIEGNKP